MKCAHLLQSLSTSGEIGYRNKMTAPSAGDKTNERQEKFARHWLDAAGVATNGTDCGLYFCLFYHIILIYSFLFLIINLFFIYQYSRRVQF